MIPTTRIGPIQNSKAGDACSWSGGAGANVFRTPACIPRIEEGASTCRWGQRIHVWVTLSPCRVSSVLFAIPNSKHGNYTDAD